MATHCVSRGIRATPSGRGRAWLMVVFLSLLAVFSYLDRYIIALLADPLGKGMHIDATDVGLLIGLGFGLLYSLSCVPIAHQLDFRNRVRIVGGGVLLWSVSTVGSAFAANFGLLFLTRVGVAFGEAVLVPATVSLVGDMFPADRRTLPIGLFMAVSSLMGSGAFVIGGLVYRAAETMTPAVPLAAWRLTLVLVGAPGLLLGLLWLLLMREPGREQAAGGEAEPSIAALRAHLGRHRGFYLPFLTSIGVAAIATYGFISWTSTMLIRSYRLTLPEAGYYYGTVGMAASGAATIFWPALLAAATRRGRIELGVPFLAAGLGAANLLVAGFAFAHSLAMAVTIIAVASFGYAAAGGLAVLIIQHAAPAGLRAKLTALYMLLGNLIGLVCGPPATAWLSEHLFTGTDALRLSLATIAAGFGAASVLLILASYPAYRVLVSERA